MSRSNVFFDIFCVLNSAGDILGRAARLQARQSYTALRSRIPLKEDVSLPPEHPDSESEVVIIEDTQKIQTVLLPQDVSGGSEEVDHVPSINNSQSFSESAPPIVLRPIHAPSSDTSTRLPLTPESDMQTGTTRPFGPIDEADFGEPEVCIYRDDMRNYLFIRLRH